MEKLFGSWIEGGGEIEGCLGGRYLSTCSISPSMMVEALVR